MIAVVRGDAEAAKEQYAFLKDRATGILPINMVCGYRTLGLLSHTLGEVDRSISHFEDSLTLCRKAGYLPELAWTCCDYADTLIQRDGTEDRAKALALLDEGLTISTGLGMLPLVDRIASLQEKLATRAPTTPAYPDGLTEREVEVLRLVSSGKSNPEIGEELFISPRTVTTHVSNILNKINAANRAEAATYASRQGLV